jgi:hypothetical protein
MRIMSRVLKFWEIHRPSETCHRSRFTSTPCYTHAMSYFKWRILFFEYGSLPGGSDPCPCDLVRLGNFAGNLVLNRLLLRSRTSISARIDLTGGNHVGFLVQCRRLIFVPSINEPRPINSHCNLFHWQRTLLATHQLL